MGVKSQMNKKLVWRDKYIIVWDIGESFLIEYLEYEDGENMQDGFVGSSFTIGKKLVGILAKYER